MSEQSPTYHTTAAPAPQGALLSAERLVELQALRDSVRQKLPLASVSTTANHVVGFLRVEALLAEGDELQRAYARQAAALAAREAEVQLLIRERDNAIAETHRWSEAERRAKAQRQAAQEEINLLEAQHAAEAAAQPFTGCWRNSACPCNPIDPNDCPCYLEPAPTASSVPLVAGQAREQEGGSRG